MKNKTTAFTTKHAKDAKRKAGERRQRPLRNIQRPERKPELQLPRYRIEVTEHDADIFASARLFKGNEWIAELRGNTSAGYLAFATDIFAEFVVTKRRRSGA